MGEISSLVFEVRNASTSTRPINELSFAVNGAAYDVDGGDAPVGWQVSARAYARLYRDLVAR